MIKQTLKDLGIQQHLLGYDYLAYAIQLCMIKPDKVHNMTTVLYKEVAEHFATTPTRVERAMRNAIGITFRSGVADVHHKIFGNTIQLGTYVPTNSHFIAAVADYLRVDEAIG